MPSVLTGRSPAPHTSGRLTFLPPPAVDWLRRTARRLCGLMVLAAGLALSLALLSYDPADPSFDNATMQPAHNLMGAPGSHVADLLVQGVGLASTAIILALFAWAWLLLLARPIARLWLRLLMLPAAVILAATAMTAAPVPAAWGPMPDAGGVVGNLMLSGVLRLLTVAGTDAIGRGAIAVVAAILALAALVPALALNLRDWRTAARGTVGAASVVARAGLMAGQAAGRLGGLASPDRSGRDGHRRRETPPAGRREPTFHGATPGGPEADAMVQEPYDPDRPPPPRFLVEPRKGQPKPGKRAQAARQPELAFDERGESYRLPALDLLEAPRRRQGREGVIDEEGLAHNARLLESVLADFGIRGEIVKVRPGPVITLYEFVPAPGTKSSRIIGLSDDIARSMSAVSVRVAVIPGRNVIGIELPNEQRELVLLRELLESASYERASAKLPLVLGKDIGGGPVIADLARMPHLLIAGTTGSGKSVAINTMILSLLYRLPPEQCRFIMIDPKMLELSVYDDIPQLLAPVVTEPQKAIVALKWAVREMEGRYQSMAKLGVRNIEGYNARIAEARRKGEVLRRRVQIGFDSETGKPIYEDQPLALELLPHIVVVVDEMADLMLVAGKEIEAAVQRLAQMARAAGLHLIMATQRPSVDVITGTIKANFPTRISFQVTSKIDSRTILGEQGAETLLGQGDMLYMAGGGRITRVHGPFVSDGEVEAVVRFLKAQGEPSYIESITEEDDAGGLPGMLGDLGDSTGNGDEALYRQAVDLVRREGKASTSFVQRHLQVGYNRAARLIDRMEAEGLITPADRVGRREVLVGRAGE